MPQDKGPRNVKRTAKGKGVGNAISGAAKGKPVDFGPKHAKPKVAGKKIGPFPAKKLVKKQNPRVASDPNPTPKTKRVGKLPDDAPIGLRNPVNVIKRGIDAVERITPKTVGVPASKQKGALRVSTAAAGSPDRRVVLNAAKDAVDIPANAVPSTYQIGKELSKGHVGKAGKMVLDGTVDALKHPVEHPLAFGLTVSGVYGGVGRGAARTLR